MGVTLLRLALLLATSVLLSCASPPASDLSSSDARCCKSVKDLPLAEVPLGALRTFAITDKSPRLKLLAGTSYVYGIRLPSSDSPSYVEFLSGREGFTTFTASIFVPTFDFYDAQFSHLLSVEPRLYQGGRRLAGFGQDFYGVAVIPEGARYLVVSTDAQRLERDKVTLIQGGGLAGERIVSADEDYYQSQDRLKFAKGEVVPPSKGNRHAMLHQISRSPTGEMKLVLSARRQ